VRRILLGTTAVRPLLGLAGAVLLCAGCARLGDRALADPDAAFRLGVTLRASGRHIDAAEAFGQFARRYESDPRAGYAQYLSGLEWAAAGELDAALAAFARLHQTFPGSRYLAEANAECLKIGEAMAESGDADCVDVLDAVVARAPFTETAARAHLALGRYYYARENFEAATVEFDAVVTEHAGTELGARADFAAALSEYRQIDRPARNLAHLLAARRRFSRLPRRHFSPREQARIDGYLAAIADLGGEHHMQMARFHLKQGTLAPALAHLEEMLRSYRSSRYSGDAAELILFIEKEAGKPTP
jgi:outer membrane protein assembly factor BamD (BamD/ComL family)